MKTAAPMRTGSRCAACERGWGDLVTVDDTVLCSACADDAKTPTRLRYLEAAKTFFLFSAEAATDSDGDGAVTEASACATLLDHSELAVLLRMTKQRAARVLYLRPRRDPFDGQRQLKLPVSDESAAARRR